jgi:hypothetical protein
MKWKELGEFCIRRNFINGDIIKIMKSRRMRWAGYLASPRRERRRMHVRYWWESQKERDH